jgi:putative ABC transport system substrate-binding protein
MLESNEVQATARSFGIEVVTPEIRRAEDIGRAFEALKGHAEAVYLAPGPLVLTNQTRISISALDARLASISYVREYVEAGALMSYGPNYSDLFRSAGDYVDKILRGTKPGDIPIQQPTKFELVINLTTAKALGLSIPEAFLLRADQVIE